MVGIARYPARRWFEGCIHCVSRIDGFQEIRKELVIIVLDIKGRQNSIIETCTCGPASNKQYASYKA